MLTVEYGGINVLEVAFFLAVSCLPLKGAIGIRASEPKVILSEHGLPQYLRDTETFIDRLSDGATDLPARFSLLNVLWERFEEHDLRSPAGTLRARLETLTTQFFAEIKEAQLTPQMQSQLHAVFELKSGPKRFHARVIKEFAAAALEDPKVLQRLISFIETGIASGWIPLKPGAAILASVDAVLRSVPGQELPCSSHVENGGK